MKADEKFKDALCFLENRTYHYRQREENIILDSANIIWHLETEIKKLKAQQRWIPVSERLPKGKQEIIVMDTGRNVYNWNYDPHLKDTFLWQYLYWMPLPESEEEE